ncbi:hypothetical protein c7_R21 [Megavirus courdo7]|uniref:Uncharacterized protein n=1 Tax=Megavirus courdo7 TaxID=1128135 RepID=H2E9L4_9VIRU|nr:hypothetical protein c7_R21 [Megavirus courdo7]
MLLVFLSCSQTSVITQKIDLSNYKTPYLIMNIPHYHNIEYILI